MRQNPLRDRLQANERSIGCWLSSPSSITAEVAARVGFDYTCIDMQHGLVDYSTIVPMLQAINLSTTTATVRVPWNEPGIIGKVLDAGAMAVIVPMVNSRAEAEAVIERGYYHPKGGRSSGPIRVQPLEDPDYPEIANDHVLMIPMIETIQAVENIDEILSIDGIDAIYVGPMDLSVSMGLGRAKEDPPFVEALDHIAARCAAHGVYAGIHGNPEIIHDRFDRGFKMVTVQSDLAAMRLNLVESLAVGRGVGVDDAGGGGY